MTVSTPETVTLLQHQQQEQAACYKHLQTNSSGTKEESRSPRAPYPTFKTTDMSANIFTLGKTDKLCKVAEK